MARKQKKPSHCKWGHRLSGENMYKRPDGTGVQCRKCNIRRCEALRRRRKQQEKAA